MKKPWFAAPFTHSCTTVVTSTETISASLTEVKLVNSGPILPPLISSETGVKSVFPSVSSEA
jgi:hypothetical protein